MLGTSRQKIIGLVVAGLVALATWFLQSQGISVGDDGDSSGTPTPTPSATSTYEPSEEPEPSFSMTLDPSDFETTSDELEPTASGQTGTDPESGLPWVSVVELPVEAQETLELIDDGGPYPYDRDGVVFENREGILPDEGHGYYHEYTVETPGEDDRGARRIVTGSSGEFYWTEDHYDSFERIDR